MTFDGNELWLSWDGIDVDVMDCMADNLAVLLRFAGVADVRSPFGCQWHLAPGLDGGIELERLPVDDLVARFTGFEARWEAPGVGGLPEAAAAHLVEGRPVLVYADAYYLPWLPYVGTAHMEHTFLLSGVSSDGRTYSVTDAYHNPTQWGPAEPINTYLDRFGLVRAVAELDTAAAGTIATVGPAGPPDPPPLLDLLSDNARSVLAATDAELITAFVDRHRERFGGVDDVAEVTLTCWLAQRSRGLHSRWLAQVAATHPQLLPPGFAQAYEDQLVTAWRRACEFSYVAQRRASLGRQAPTGALDLLVEEVEPAEAALATQLHEHLGTLEATPTGKA